MNNTIFFIDSEYSERKVASRPIKQFALDEINYYEFRETLSRDIIIFVKSNLIGLNNQIVNEFIEKKDRKEVLIGLLDSEACLIAINADLLNKILPGGDLIFDNISKEWPRYDLTPKTLKLLNNTAKIITFNEEVQNKLRKNAVDNGVHLEDPATTYLSYDTEFGNEVLVEPNVYFGQKVKVYDNVHIKAFSYLEGVQIAKGAEIGPFARIRGSSIIGNNVRIGNFVEIKNSVLGSHTKASHLSYIGDAQVGENVNIGAGVVTCNYDGLKKYNTVINNDTFVGSNSTLIAPITIGTRSFIGAGSFINTDVPNDTFAIGRSNQNMKPNKRK